jgi:hypothetical protein
MTFLADDGVWERSQTGCPHLVLSMTPFGGEPAEDHCPEVFSGRHSAPARWPDSSACGTTRTTPTGSTAGAARPGRVTASTTGGVELWGVNRGELVASLPGKGAGGTSSVGFSPDGRRLAISFPVMW